MNKINLNWQQVQSRAIAVAEQTRWTPWLEALALYGIPRGGIYAAQLVSAALAEMNVLNVLLTQPDGADVFIDDIIDTGATRDKYAESYPGVPFVALVDKLGKDNNLRKQWISFPWERMMNDDGPVENIRRILEYIGEDPKRDGLKDTPQRVIESYAKLFGGYKQKPEDVVRIFDDPCDEMVIVKDVEFYSTCEHHMLPFWGKAHIAYIPNGKIIGISKLVRILEIYSRRLQIQERLCSQVATAVHRLLNPLGAACVLEAQHLCMTARGVEKQNSVMVTQTLIGFFKDRLDTRSEFMSAVKK